MWNTGIFSSVLAFILSCREILSAETARYSYPIDMWSFGTVAYKLLTGNFPSPPILFGNLAGRVSQRAISFLAALLSEDPHTRATAAEIQQHAFLCHHPLLNIFTENQLHRLQSKALPDINFAPLSLRFSSQKAYKTTLGQLTIGILTPHCSPKQDLSMASSPHDPSPRSSVFLSLENNITFEVSQKMIVSIWMNNQLKATWKKCTLPAPLAPIFYYIYRVVSKVLSKIPKAVLLLEKDAICGILMSNGPFEDFLFQNGTSGTNIYRIVPKMSKIFVYDSFDDHGSGALLSDIAKSSLAKRSQIVIRKKPVRAISIETSFSFQSPHHQDLCNASMALNLHAKLLRLVQSSKKLGVHPLIFVSSASLASYPLPHHISSHSVGSKSREEQLYSSMDCFSGFSATSVMACSASSPLHIAACTRDPNGVFHVFFSDNSMLYIIPERSLCWNKDLKDWMTTETPLLDNDIKARVQLFSQNFFNFGMAPTDFIPKCGIESQYCDSLFGARQV